MYQDVETFLQQSRPIIQIPSQQQEEALKLALRQPLTVVQGGPGTGKSVLVAKLGCMYVQRNRSQPSYSGQRNQVLICAPTETAVDVISSKKCCSSFTLSFTGLEFVFLTWERLHEKLRVRQGKECSGLMSLCKFEGRKTSGINSEVPGNYLLTVLVGA